MNSLSRTQLETLIQSGADDLQIAKTIAIQSKPDQTKTLVGGALLALAANVVFPGIGPIVVLALTLDKFLEQRREGKAIAQRIERGEVWDYLSENDRQYFPQLNPLTSDTASDIPQTKSAQALEGHKQAASDIPKGKGADIILGDLVNLMVHEPRPTILSAVPRTGKGYLIAQAIERFKAKGYTVWVLQPKPALSELPYWKCADRFLGVELENYQRDSEGVTELMTDFIFKWRAQNTLETPSILVIDELVKIQAMMPRWYRDFLIPQAIVEGSSGETAQRFLYLITQSPLVSDIGMSGGNRSAFEFIALEKATSQPHAESIKASVRGLGELPPIDAYGRSPVGTLAYYSRLNGWVPIPRWDTPRITPADVLCPELDRLVNSAKELYPDVPVSDYGNVFDYVYGGLQSQTATKARSIAAQAAQPQTDDARWDDEARQLCEAAIATLMQSPGESVAISKLVPNQNLRKRHGAELIGRLSNNANIQYESSTKGSVTSHRFTWTVSDGADESSGGEFDID
jgi:hypothetical protein